MRGGDHGKGCGAGMGGYTVLSEGVRAGREGQVRRGIPIGRVRVRGLGLGRAGGVCVVGQACGGEGDKVKGEV